MLYTTWAVGDKQLKLRLNARTCVELERKLKQNPLNLLASLASSAEGSNVVMPKLEDIISIFHASLQAFEHGYTEDKVYELYDEYIEAGGSLMDIIPVMIEIFKVSGFFKEEVIEEKAGKKKTKNL